MRASTYPPGLRSFLKIAPACMIYVYFMCSAPILIYSTLYHSKERVARSYFKNNYFMKQAIRRDDIARLYYRPAIEHQPTDKRPDLEPAFLD